MNVALLHPQVQQFINEHLKADLTQLILKGSPFPHIDIKDIVAQIASKNKAEKKLPHLFATACIYYPPKLNLEQTSSEETASYKAALISGQRIIDLTGGMGIDTFAFAKNFDQVVHCELNPELSAIAQYNFKQLQISNVQALPTDGLKFLAHSGQKFDWIYVDPSRRHGVKGKVFRLEDCQPDLTEELSSLWAYTDQVMVKTAPLLDISSGMDQLNGVFQLHIVAVNNEVKELLWLMRKDHLENAQIIAVNLMAAHVERFSFVYGEEASTEAVYGPPSNFLYEPNAAVMKSGGFNQVAHQYGLKKLHRHSHLYTSDQLIDFPGRKFKIEEVLPYHRKGLKKLSYKQANMTTRNFPESVQNLRKASGIKDGGDYYLFFTTDHLDQKIILVCSKVDRPESRGLK